MTIMINCLSIFNYVKYVTEGMCSSDYFVNMQNITQMFNLRLLNHGII